MVITLSRQAEAGGEAIAALVAKQTGIRVADRLIVEQMAQRAGIAVSAVELFDEAVPGAIESLLAEWQTSVSHLVYLRRLIHTLLSLEREDNVIVIGRGAAFVLRNPGTLHVRVVAPLPCRIARLLERQAASPIQVERLLRRSDEERQRFVRQSFGADIDSPVHYDAMLNTAELPAEAAAEMIIRAAQRKAERRQEAVAEAVEDLIAETRRLRQRPHQPRVSGTVWQSYERRRTRPY